MNCTYMVTRLAQGASSIPGLVVALVLGAWLPLFGCSVEKGNPGVMTGESAQAGETAQIGGSGQVGESVEGADVSDLDESVEALLAKACEHGIAQHTCDECRYEVGMVEVSPDLFAPGGLLSTVRATARPSGAGRILNGEVALDADKAVQITPRVPGVVRSVQVDVGSPVARGQVLLVLDSPDVSI